MLLKIRNQMAEDIEIIDYEPSLTEKQTIAWDALDTAGIKEVLYGGAKGGGKSVFGCMWCFNKAIEIIKDCNIARRKHPIPVGFMGRKRGVDFTNTTLETWKRFIPQEAYEIKSKPAEIIIADRVKILTGGLDNTEVVNKFNSAEFAFFFIDQAEEVDASQIGELRATFRLIINDKKIKGKGLFTANPAPSFLKDEFILNPTPDRVFIQALPTDNHYLGDEYIDVLKDSFRNRPELLKAYLEGSWDALGGFNQVIKDSWIQNAGKITLYPPRLKRLITCDPARYGDDETVIYLLKNTEIAESEICGKKSLMHTANILHTISHKNGDCLIVVDVCGIGAGVVDRLIEMGDNVLGIDNASKSEEPEKYYNLRSQIWCKAADMFADGDIQLKNADHRLQGQLCTPRYEFRHGKILIEAKADIKKRLGNSPDRADAYVNGVYALDFVEGELVGRKDSYSEDEDDVYSGSYTAMAM
jgi:phage terminase large subunit